MAALPVGNRAYPDGPADGAVACWGDDDHGQATPPDGEFVSVSVGEEHTCGVRTDGVVECWGWNEDEAGNFVAQATPPKGEFISVGAGAFHTYGVRTNGSVECWGSNLDTDGSTVGQATPSEATVAGLTPAGNTPTGESPAEETPTATPVAEVQDTFQTSHDEYLAVCGIALRTLEEAFEEPSFLKAARGTIRGSHRAVRVRGTA